MIAITDNLNLDEKANQELVARMGMYGKPP